MAEIPFAHEDDYIIEDVSLAVQDKFVRGNNLEAPDLFIEGVLNDTTVYVLPDNYVAGNGYPYKFLILGHVYATPNSNMLYIHYTNHESTYEKWADIQDEQYEED